MKPLLKSKKFWLMILASLIIIGLVSWARLFAAPKEAVTVFPEYRDLKSTLNVSGYIDASEKATLTFPALSRLSWVGVKEGDWVKKWQSIASVDTQTLQKQLQIDLNNFNKEYRDHDQTLDDYDYYNRPDLDKELRRILENAQFDLDNSVLAVEIRDLAIRLSTIFSPINGLVTHIDKPLAGLTISPTDTFEIVNPSTIYFKAIVDEEDIGRLTGSPSAIISLDAFPDEQFTSRIETIDFSPTTTEGGGTGYAVKLTLPVDNANLRYRLGLNGEADIVLEEKPHTLTLPYDTLITKEGQDYVEVKRGNTIETLPVETGVITDDHVEILSGLSSTDPVILPTFGE